MKRVNSAPGLTGQQQVKCVTAKTTDGAELSTSASAGAREVNARQLLTEHVGITQRFIDTTRAFRYDEDFLHTERGIRWYISASSATSAIQLTSVLPMLVRTLQFPITAPGHSAPHLHMHVR